MTRLEHDWNHYVGIPFKDGGRTPDGFDCWGVVKYIGLRHFGVSVPDWSILAGETSLIKATIEAEKMSQRWRPVPDPERLKPGDVCLLGQNGDTSHAGIYVGPGVLHAERGAGVMFSTTLNLRRRYRYCEWWRWQG